MNIPERPPLRLGPAVENGRLRYVSASQVTTASHDQDGGCLRRWWFDKVAGLTAPQTSAQDVGVRVHAELDHYIRTGEDVLGPIARGAKPYIPPAAVSEFGFGVVREPDEPRDRLVPDLIVAGLPVVGFVDVLNGQGWRSEYANGWVSSPTPEAWTPSGVPEAIDWKTSKDPGRYAKVGAALVRTVQMPLYGALLFRLFPKAEQVRVSHVTLSTGKRVDPVPASVVLTPLTVEGRILTISATVERMKAAAMVAGPSAVDFNAESCGSFGGCPFAAECPRPAHLALRAALGGKADAVMSDLLDDLMKPSTPTPPAAPSTPPAKPAAPFGGLQPGKDPMPAGLDLAGKKAWITAANAYQLAQAEAEEAPAPAAAPKRATIKAGAARMNAKYLIEFSTGLVPATYVGLTRGGRSFARDDGQTGTILLQDDEEVFVGDGVVAPDAPAAGTTGPVATPIPATDTVPEAIRKAAAEVAPEPAPPAAPAEKPKRTRKKAEPEAPPAPPPTEPTPQAVADATKALIDTDPAPSETAARAVATFTVGVEHTPATDGKPAVYTANVTPSPPPVAPDEITAQFVLLIDCDVVAGTEGGPMAVKSLASVIEKVHKGLREKFKCDDVRFASKDSALGFGAWRGVLAAAMRVLHEAGEFDGYYRASTAFELESVAIEALLPVADVVIRGR